MLNRVASAIERALQTDSVVRMTRDFLRPAVRFIHNRFQFLYRQRRLRHESPFFIHPRPVGHVDLNPVRSVLQLLPCSFPRFYRAVHDLHPLGHVQLRCVIFQVVPARGGNGARYTKKSRPGNGALFDRLFDLDISIARAFRFHITKCGESLFQRPAHRKGSARCPQSNSGLQDIGVVPSFFRVFAPKKNVRVRIDESRQHRRIRKVNHVRSRGNGFSRPPRPCYSYNPFTVHKNQLVLSRRFAHTINQRPRANHR